MLTYILNSFTFGKSLLGRSHFKKNGNFWDKVPKGGGGGLTQTQIFVHNFLFLETTNLASAYLKTWVTLKIWLNLMHTNLISRVIHATVPFPGGVVGVFLIEN